MREFHSFVSFLFHVISILFCCLIRCARCTTVSHTHTYALNNFHFIQHAAKTMRTIHIFCDTHPNLSFFTRFSFSCMEAILQRKKATMCKKSPAIFFHYYFYSYYYYRYYTHSLHFRIQVALSLSRSIFFFTLVV